MYGYSSNSAAHPDSPQEFVSVLYVKFPNQQVKVKLRDLIKHNKNRFNIDVKNDKNTVSNGPNVSLHEPKVNQNSPWIFLLMQH